MIGLRSDTKRPISLLSKRKNALFDPSFRSARPQEWIEYKISDVENESMDSLSIHDLLHPMSNPEILTAYRCASEILEEQTEDVVTSLTQYYNKKGVPNLRSCFSEKSTNSKKKGSVLWRCSFHCPLSGSEVSSSLPFSLLERPGLEEFHQLIRTKFGDYVLNNEVACFYSKKAAKKSCALAMLVTILIDASFEDMTSTQAPDRSIPIPNGIDTVPKNEEGIFFSTWISEWLSVPFVPCKPSYLYEMAFCTESGTPWSATLNLDKSSMTRIGILFPVDIDRLRPDSPEEDSTHRASFSIDEDGEKMMVELVNRTEIDPLPDTAASCRSLDSLKQVNRALMNWKSYGIGFHKEVEEKTSRRCRPADLDGRTYLFVPLEPEGSETTLRIDWDMIIDEVSLNARPFLGTNKDLSEDESSAGVAKSLSEKELCNRVLVHRKLRYIATAEKKPSKNAHSDFPALGLTDAKIERMIRRYDLDLRNASFSDYYLKRYGLHIKDPGEALLPAYTVNKLSDFSREDDSRMPVYLIPEFIQVLPLPLDFLFIAGLAEKYMPELEREITIAMYSDLLQNHLAQNSHLRLASPHQTLVQERDNWTHRRSSLTDLLIEATTVYPSITYERLEFVGDAVLGFFLALNAMACNFMLIWDYEDIEEIISKAGNNNVLARASLRLPLAPLIRTEKTHWRSSYRGGQTDRKPKMPPPAHGKVLLPNSTLSDTLESLLAATYLFGLRAISLLGNEGGRNDATDGELVVVILDQLLLPFPFTTYSSRWFFSPGSCLKCGYPFQLDSSWNKRLFTLRSLIASDEEIQSRLEAGSETLLALLPDSNSELVQEKCRQSPANTLICSALFDDSLGASEYSVASTGSDRSCPSSPAFVQLALLRDTLYQVGAFGLHLMLSEEVYRRFPEAEPGDLHLLRSCAITDDIVVYVMFKSGIHQALFDADAPCISNYAAEMNDADAMGLALWNERGGWVLEGGVAEFRRRAAAFTSQTGTLASAPQYSGVAGGRLCGHSKKLPGHLTEDLMFSFKAIFGALVLSLGLEATWDCICPYFQELLLLSPDELRSEYGQQSSLVQSYQAGNRRRKRNRS